MDNPGFQPDIETGQLHEATGNENVSSRPNSSNPYVIFSDNKKPDIKSFGGKNSSSFKKNHSMLLLAKPGSSNMRSPKLSSSSFNLPKKSNVCKYRRFSGSLSIKRSRVNVLKEMIEDPRRNNSISVPKNDNVRNNEPMYCSISELKPKNFKPEQGKHVVDISSISSLYRNNSTTYDCPVNNNLKSSFRDQKSSKTTSVPSSPSVRNYNINRSHSSRETQRYTPSPSLLKQSKRINKLDNTQHFDTMKLSAASCKDTNYNNCSPINTAQDSDYSPSPSDLKKMNQFAVEDDSIMSSLAYLAKCNNHSHMCMDSVAVKNTRNLQQDYLRSPEGISTVSGGVPMFHPGLYQQSSPRPCADNKKNLRRSSKMLAGEGERGARLKRTGMMRGWKLQFIPSGHSQRRNLALCCILGLACALILLATGMVVYVTTVMGSLTDKLEGSRHVTESGVNVVAGEFRILNERFEPSLRNNSSPDFLQLAAQITQLLDLVLSRSTLGGNYNHSHVTRLVRPAAPGVLVQCQVVLGSAPPLGEAANQVGLEFLRGLEHHQGQMWLGDFAVDVQSIGFVALLEDPPAANSTPRPSLQPGWSAWSTWSACNSGNSGFTQSRTRLCRLDRGAGSPLSSIEPCLLLEAGGGDLEVRDCGHTVDIVMASSMFDNTNRSKYSINSLIASSPATTSDTMWVGNNASEVHSSNPAATTARIPVMDLSLSLRHCDECVEGEVCVALSKEQVPVCRHPLDQADPTGCGGHCIINTELCQKLDVDAFRCVDDSYCLPTEWRCANQLCIPQVKRCDGHMNCYDRTDEHDCDCDLSSHFHCGNNTSCLPTKKRCDGIIDCWDGTDELNCTIACPSTSQFTCTDGQCIPRARFCDGYADCIDGSDEPFGCGGECKNHEWKCKNGRCIKKQTVCDSTDTCGDQSDEMNCPLSRRERNFNYGIAMDKLYVRR